MIANKYLILLFAPSVFYLARIIHAQNENDNNDVSRLLFDAVLLFILS
jgi:hypothetical protein